MHIQTHHIAKSFEGSPILSDVSFVIPKGERVGIVGVNGSGKTTLLKILAELESLDGGSVSIEKSATIGYIPQAPDFDETQTVAEILVPLVSEGEAHLIKKALDMLHIGEWHGTVFGTLSSGQKTRVYLARIIIEERDILLLDEPTNHLDTEALEWLERYLRNYRGTICVVSHDRVFLDNSTTRTFELSAGKVREYGGNYSFYKEQKTRERDAYVRAYEAQQKEIKRLKTTARDVKADAERTDADRKQTRDNDKYATTFFANRASNKKSAAAKSIERRLGMTEEMERPDIDPKLSMLFSPRDLGSWIVVQFNKVSYATPEARVLDDISFTIEREDRIILSGPNGSGKTTLVKLILGQLHALSGEVSRGASVKIGYLSQEHDSLETTHSVSEELIEKTGIDTTLAYRLLSWLQVSRDKMSQPVNTLSKGEQSKVLLAEIIASGANFIILDEPTNHLDIPARESIEAALRKYRGTLLVISHDRYFVEAVHATRTLHLEHGTIKHI